MLSKLLGAKALAAVVLGTASVGTAAAAATGNLPDPAQAAAHRVVSAVPDSDRAEPAGELSRAGKPATDRDTLPGAAGLCRAYGSGRGGEQGARADASGFQRLAEAAGGPEAVAAYCAKVLATAPAASTPPGAGAADAALRGTCRAWLAADRQGRTAELGKATLDRLAAAAGGAGSVETYCTGLVDAGPAGQAPRPAESSPARGEAPEAPGAGGRADRSTPSHPARPTPRG